jgi:hypothetical protein
MAAALLCALANVLYIHTIHLLYIYLCRYRETTLENRKCVVFNENSIAPLKYSGVERKENAILSVISILS